MNRKQVLGIILIAFFVGALGSIILGHYVLPFLSKSPGLGWLSKITTNAPIIINRTEQVQLNDGANMIDLVKQSGRITVSIFDLKNGFLGNGIVVTSDGLIFTSANMGPKQTQVIVMANDGQTYPGTVEEKDPKTGLGIVTIRASGLTSAQFDRAADLVAGQRVIYIGRSNVKSEHMIRISFVTQSLANQMGNRVVSTDANLTSDFSGGPILDFSGNVVGLVLDNSQNIISEDLQTALTTYLSK